MRAVCSAMVVSLAASAGVRQRLGAQMEAAATVGYSSQGTPLPPELLDFNPAASDADFAFDVEAISPGNQGDGGGIRAVDGADNPALRGQGMAITLFNLAPGGENLPHLHPRATEMVYLVRGGPIEVAFTDGAGNVHQNTVTAGQATIFPRALIHYQRNIGSVEAQYVSILNSENPGVVSLPRSLFALPDQALANALREDVAEVRFDRDRVLPSALNQPATGRVSAGGAYDGAAGAGGNAPVPMHVDGTGGSAPSQLAQTLAQLTARLAAIEARLP